MQHVNRPIATVFSSSIVREIENKALIIANNAMGCNCPENRPVWLYIYLKETIC